MKNIHGFTFVELIVVITIIAILGSIGFMSYNSYIGESRDASRLSQVSSMYKALESYRTKGFLPLPERKITIYASGTIIGYQGYIGLDALNSIGYQDEGLDPKDGEYFTYYLAKDLRRAQIMTFLEDEILISHNYINKTNAANYSDRIPYVYGVKLGILTESGTNIPIQEIPSIVATGTLDIVNTNSSFTAYISEDYKVSGTGIVLAFLKDGAGKNCKDILYKDPGKQGMDGVYYINPMGTGSFQVYCDMKSDGGGWTLVANITSITESINYISYRDGLGTPNLNDITATGAWIIAADIYDSIGKTMRINMGTVRDYFKPKVGYTVKNMVMSYDKHLWSNSANGIFYDIGSPLSFLGGGLASNQKNFVHGDTRKYISFWGGSPGNSGCCHYSISEPESSSAWQRKFSMWIR